MIPNGYLSSWAQYTIQVENQEIRDGLQVFLKENGIPTMVYYPKPMHKQKAFADLKLYQECPITEKLCQTVLSLPMHPYLTDEEITLVSANIKDYIQNHRCK